MTTWPSPDATHEEVEAFVRKNAPTTPVVSSTEPAHEVPPMENGPSAMCNACGLVRVSLFTTFCKACAGELAAGGG